jgi:hypothetical protein
MIVTLLSVYMVFLQGDVYGRVAVLLLFNISVSFVVTFAVIDTIGSLQLPSKYDPLVFYASW